MRTVAVVGSTGFVGAGLLAALAARDDLRVTGVTRSGYDEHRTATWDVVVNAAMPAARFRARTDPAWDFTETVAKTADLASGWTAGKIVQISSVSARSQLDTVYGRHKAAAERLVDSGGNLVVRLGSMYDRTLRKGVLIDMLHGRKVWVDGRSRYCFAPLEFVVRWIAAHLDRTGVVEVGARDAVALADVAAHLGSPSTFEGPLDHQEIPTPEPGFPAARDVLAFLDAEGAALRAATEG